MNRVREPAVLSSTTEQQRRTREEVPAMSSITFSASALTHVPSRPGAPMTLSSCAAMPMTVSSWNAQLPTPVNGVVAAAAKNRTDGRGARAFEDPL
jgi:hypothetical protein